MTSETRATENAATVLRSGSGLMITIPRPHPFAFSKKERLDRSLAQCLSLQQPELRGSRFLLPLWPLPRSSLILPFLSLLNDSLDPRDVPSARILSQWLHHEGFRGSIRTLRRYLRRARSERWRSETAAWTPETSDSARRLTGALYLLERDGFWAMSQVTSWKEPLLEIGRWHRAGTLLPVVGRLGEVEKWRDEIGDGYLTLAAAAGNGERERLTALVRHPDGAVRRAALQLLPLVRCSGGGSSSPTPPPATPPARGACPSGP